MKTKYIHRKVSHYGGIVPILHKLKEKGIPQLIKECLGTRPKQSTYSYEEALTTWFATIFCHGYRLLRVEDTKADLALLEDLKIPSHDTIGRIMKQLATPTFNIENINKNKLSDTNMGISTHKICEHKQLNELLIMSTIKMGLLKKGTAYTLDIDATALVSKVKESDYTYKKHKGFMPMVCMIDKCPVYISMRGGNTNPQYNQIECIQDALSFLNKNGITVTRVRIDGAGYQKNLIKYLHSVGIKFVISAPATEKVKMVTAFHRKWTSHLFEYSNNVIYAVQTAARSFKMKGNKTEFRMIAMRSEGNVDDESPFSWKQINKHAYKFIITNDFETEEINLFYEYKLRGAIEQNFASLKNDFGWKIMPFSKLNQNLVYLILTSLANNIYQGLLHIFSKSTKAVKNVMQLKTFRRVFISVILMIIDDTYTFIGGSKEIDFAKIA